MARMKAVNPDASKIRQIKVTSQEGWLGISRSVETEAGRFASHVETRQLVSVPDYCHRVGMWAPCHQSFPFSKRSKAFGIFRCEISPFLNVGPNSLKTHLWAKPNISEG